MTFKADTQNPQLEGGIWGEYDGAQFLIAHTSSMKFQRALSRNQQPHVKKIQAGTLDPEVNRRVLCAAMAEGMLLDWKIPGDTEPYTVKAGTKALMNQPAFRDFVSDFAIQLENFRQEDKADLGNS